MKPLLMILSTILVPAFAMADLAGDFEQMLQRRKGPFSLNYLQGTAGRVIVNRGHPAGRFLFQAAYRNEEAQDLIKNHGFYLGNLFTTNYYQLMGEFVFSDPLSNHDLDHQGLLKNAAPAMQKATLIVKHWVLEKHYLESFPGTKLHQAFQLRGISDVENEREYANYFFNFYLSSMTSDLQYLPAVLLIKASPISQSAAINKARHLIASVYDEHAARLGANDSRVRRLYKLRNAIHNQLSETVIAEIDRYLADHRDGRSDLLRIRQILVDYYSVSARKIIALAESFGAADLAQAAKNYDRGAIDGLVEVSAAVANLRSQLTASRVAHEKKTEALLLVTKAAQFAAKELSKVTEISPEAVQVIVNAAYAEGFLIEKNRQYFLGKARGARSSAEAAKTLADVISIAQSTLSKAVEPALRQWQSIEPKMHGFIDSELKSSALNSGSILLEGAN